VNFPRTALLLTLLAVLAAGGCGYYFPHVYEGTARTIYMPNWSNRTSQLGLDTELYQTLSRWFQKSGAITLTKNREEADMILAGEIVNIDLPSVSWDSDARTSQAKVRLEVRYILKNIDTDTIMWEVPREIWTEAFSTAGGASALAEAERIALDRIITDLSERIYIGTLDKLRKSDMKAAQAE
jgi:outer membrane lipopolysaccharide assembly protein LptE/RlpB